MAEGGRQRAGGENSGEGAGETAWPEGNPSRAFARGGRMGEKQTVRVRTVVYPRLVRWWALTCQPVRSRELLAYMWAMVNSILAPSMQVGPS